MSKAAAVQMNPVVDDDPVLERRKSERADLVVRVEYKNVDELFSEFACNINEGGIFIETDSPPEQGSSVDLQFRLPGSDEPVRARGIVVRVTHGDASDPPGIGIEFEELDGSTRDRIDELVRRLRAAAPA